MAKQNGRKSKSKTFAKGYDEKDTQRNDKGSKRKGQKGERGCEKPYGGNDVSWYNRNPALLEAAGNIPFPWQPGRSIDNVITYPNPGTGDTVNIDGSVWYPGICTLGYYPSVGQAIDVSSPINIAAREIYGRIRSKYSGSLEADAPDIMMYLLALDSLYMIYEDLKRAYYLVNLYTPHNTLFPKQIITALGYNFEDLMINKVKMYQYLVEGGAMLAKFRVPDNMDLYKRHAFMSANLYADSPLPKAQIYAFTARGFYTLSNTDTKTSLNITAWNNANSSTMSLESAWTKFKAAINKLMAWDTGYTILGYLERAYEGESFLIPSAPLMDGQILPVYNLEVLTQIQNTRALPVRTYSLRVEQDPLTNNLLSRPTVNIKEQMAYNPRWRYIKSQSFITLPTVAQPTAQDIAVATRLHPGIGSFPTSFVTEDDPYIDLYCGTEVVSDVLYWNHETYFPALSLRWTDVQFDVFSSESEPADALAEVSFALDPVMELLTNASAFNMHPSYFISYIGYDDPDSIIPVYHKHSLVADTDNLTVVDDTTLENLHRICIYSEFNCFPS